jgi:FkbM family methyltransferase
LLTPFRKAVDTHLPLAGRAYRLARDVGGTGRFKQTSYGFRLAGSPAMTEDGFEICMVSALLSGLETHDVVVDIGANVGFYSCLASSRGKHVLAFEPSERNLRFLFRNLWENEFRNVEVFPLGLGTRCGLSAIYGFGGISSFVPGWAQAEKARFSVVPVTTLDSIIGTRFEGQRLLIKMDVEGFELDVLGGASAILSMQPHPTWLVEILLRDAVVPGGVNPRFRDVFEVFRSKGYQCRKLDQGQTPVSEKDVERWQAQEFVEDGTTNFLFS